MQASIKTNKQITVCGAVSVSFDFSFSFFSFVNPILMCGFIIIFTIVHDLNCFIIIFIAING